MWLAGLTLAASRRLVLMPVLLFVPVSARGWYLYEKRDTREQILRGHRQ
jgi:hypothetical protein